jgi:positive regulator of sigma E activity
MPKTKDHKHLQKIALIFHILNERVNVGWTIYLSPYISMLYYLSLMEIVVAKLFPDLFTSATALAVASYIVFIWLSYSLGKRHERMTALEKKMRRQMEEDTRIRLAALEKKMRRRREGRK